MAEGDKTVGTPPGDALGALYRTLPPDEPPPEIDAAILAASRRSVAAKPAREWATPVGLAAVLVLSVGVSLRVADERPEALRPEPPSAQAPSVSPSPAAKPADAPGATEAPARESVVAKQQPAVKIQPSAPAPERRAQRSAPDAAAAGSEASQDAAKREVAPQERAPSRPATDQPPITFVPSPRADSASPPGPGSPAITERLGRSEVRSAAPAAPPAGASDARSQMLSKSASAESTLAAAGAQTPEAWLERIARLRAEGRHKEADESFAEFRRQHPDHVIAPQTLQRIAPSR